MDEADSRSELVEDVDGVELTKYLEEEGFRFPSIVYEITSTRDEAVTVRVEDTIPDGVDVEDVGFHPAYGDDYWSVDDGTLVFEYELEPNAQYKTVYAVRGTAQDEIEDVLESPETVDIEAAAAGEPEALTRSAAESPYDSGEQPAGGIEIDSELESTAEELSDQIAEQNGEAEPASEPLVDRLAAEIEEGRASDESLEILEAALDASGTARGSVDARLQQIQSDISDLRAYTTALESFLDENGGAEAVIEAFESRQDDFEGDLEAVESSVSELTDQLDSVEGEIADLDDSVGSVSSDLTDVSERLDGLEADLADLDDRVPAYSIDERFADVEAELETISDFVDSLQSAFQ